MYGLRTVLAGNDISFRKRVREKLSTEGFLVVGEAADGWNALQMVLNIQPDLVILHHRLSGRDGLEVAEFIDEHRLAPVVLVGEVDSQLAIREALDHWLFSYILEPVDEFNLFPAIDSSRAAFRKISSMQEEYGKLKQAIEIRKVVDRAKGLLMSQKGLTEQQAFRYLQKLSMDKCVPVEKIASKVIKLLAAMQ